MMYIDNHGNIIDRTEEIHTLLDKITGHLVILTKEDRIALFKQSMYLEALNFVKKINVTLYAVRTFFKKDAGKNIAEKVERIVLKME